jgi:outer membrane protein assembly factor BamC
MTRISSTRLLICLLAALAVSGCGTISEKRKIDYKTTRTLPPLEVPPDLSSLPAERGAASAPGTAVSTYSELLGDRKKTPVAVGPTAVLPEYRDARIERDGQVRWLVVKGETEAMWGRMREFVLAHGLLVAKENPASGVIETEWAENRAKVGTAGQMLLGKWLGTLYSTGTRDKFRLRLERGASPGTSEIYITHQAMEEVISRAGVGGQAEATRWQPRASDPELETEMLRLLVVYLGAGEEQTRRIAAAAPAPVAEKPAQRARLTRLEKGASILSLEESLDRAWRRVGLTLDRVGFTVQDRDRSRGVYYIRYVDPDKKSKTARDDEYLIHLKSAEAGTVVEVLNKDGKPESSPSGERILGLLHEQLK